MSEGALRASALAAPAQPRRGLSLVELRDRLLFVSVLAGFFVMVEPSPNELLVAVGFLVLLATGISYPRSALPLAWMLLALNIGGAASALPVIGKDKVAIFVIISVFLMVYALYFVILFSENTLRRLELMRQAWIIGATIAALLGIVGYFNIGGTRDLFTLYASRAKGTFNDPNVFGPFLILPILFLVQGFLEGAKGRVMLRAAALAILMIGLFLSFSRAAWGHIMLSLALMCFLLFVVSTSSRYRTRMIVLMVGGLLLAAVTLAVLLSIDEVRRIFELRFSLNQDYDTRAGGRFYNFGRGVQVILDNPNGIGPFEFGRRYGEDPHNAYLHTFIAYGWAGGMAYLAIVATTFWLAWRMTFVSSPYQPYVIPVVATFTGTTVMGVIIHSDHWRHWYLLVGLIWALSAATEAWRRARDQGRPFAA